MSGVWLFRDGVATLVRNPMKQPLDNFKAWEPPKKQLVYRATNEVITSFDLLEDKLFALGWERCDSEAEESRQYFRSVNGPYFISLPADFTKLKTTHMYDIVVQSRTAFEVRDVLKHHQHS
ncbi:hypothetical protein SELMODRAFT_122532 [Selaginella moellendorffii]|uniref:Uncharacterized protein n=1 Tax=Selaginella moellendorffii TaxID=88036 RepID=D8SQ60_SELML|nr:flowering-promoting factor 1 [Selaginella moellendorffii]XP_002987046.1 flowering-promoting factor 1 [Selaginella moellendorffii]EFJ11889.1 hypothetical protein SELMODRAFT_125211 [Selaginella moellendorffii]EFJ13398.1 hypothetical protein SELMODRAFT_122532 [Selaginella moellendorffii]|eukprot:XP_002985524.1 flowering-promoting factor 1 [Selaginella moellendorffii]